jgi:Family of unknown function (DUF6364)
MKAKLTVTLDEELIPKAKRYARSRGISLSQLIETSLRVVTSDQGTFSQRWRGRFEPAGRDDERYKALSAKYL